MQKILEQYPERVTPLIFDVTNSEELSAEVTRISPLLNQGNLAALINNAGFAVPGPLELLDDIQFENQINVNLLV